jgi:hypothetical protein
MHRVLKRMWKTTSRRRDTSTAELLKGVLNHELQQWQVSGWGA